MTETATKITLEPTADRLVVRPTPENEKTKGGIVLPDIAKDKPVRGTVVAIGPGAMVDGKRVPLDLKVNDEVIYSKYAGTEVKLNDEDALILREQDILAVIRD
jgi:chaperonin GroES